MEAARQDNTGSLQTPDSEIIEDSPGSPIINEVEEQTWACVLAKPSTKGLISGSLFFHQNNATGLQIGINMQVISHVVCSLTSSHKKK